MRDVFRTADFLQVPFRWARPDPVVMDLATCTYPTAQPYIHRLSQLGAAAAERGRGLAFIAAVSQTIWSGTIDNLHEGDHLANAAGAAGLDLVELDAAVAADPDRHHAVIMPPSRRTSAPSAKAAITACPSWYLPGSRSSVWTDTTN